MANLFDRAVNKYREDGMGSLARAAYRTYIKRPVADELISPVFSRLFGPAILSRTVERERLLHHCSNDQSVVTEAESVVQLTPPKGDSRHPVFEELVGEYTTQELHVCELSDVELFGDKGIIVTDEGQFVLESVKGEYTYLENDLKSNPAQAVLSTTGVPGHQTFGTDHLSGEEFVATSLVDHTGKANHYGHWLVEYLPMLFGLEQYESETGTEPFLIINADPPEWMIESLSLLGYDENRLIEWDGGPLKIDNFVLPTTGHITPSWEFSPKSRQWVGRKVRDWVDHTGGGGKRIFVSREGLDKRSLRNLDQIRPVLDYFDIKVIDPRTMTFRDQVSLYANAELLIGPSGSGLHNMMFPETTTVIELFHPEYVTTYNYRLAEAFEHEYRFILGNETNGDQRRPVKDRCFTVSPSTLKSALEGWVADSEDRIHDGD